MLFLALLLLSCEKSPEKEPESCTPLLQFLDADGDGVGAEASASVCTGTPGFVATTGDCDDEDPGVYPGAAEVCDNLDNNCDALADEGLEQRLYADQDADGYGDPSQVEVGCAESFGWVTDATDCDDSDAAVYPEALERCDGLDNNCDGNIDEGLEQSFYADQDVDGYGDPSQSLIACTAPSGWVANDLDCDDMDNAVNPEEPEICDSLDNNCDGAVDEGLLQSFYADQDADGYGNPSQSRLDCTASPGWLADPSDCDDSDGAVHPTAFEYCDGFDNNCDGSTDGSDALDVLSWYLDADGDGYGAGAAALSCLAPAGYVADNRDCDDQNNAINRGELEVCNGIDDDCDGAADDADSYASGKSSWYLDADGDGYGVRTSPLIACTPPAGYSALPTDCDDADAARYPTAPEPDCTDPVDYNCDYHTAYADFDQDGWPACLDCNDLNGNTRPDAGERCFDGVDNNCDGSIDGPDSYNATTWYADQDTDNYGDPSQALIACTAPSGYVYRNTDCDDQSSAIHPGGYEPCDGVDNDCSGVADDNPLYQPTFYPDVDGDTHGDNSAPIRACTSPAGYLAWDGDCDDTDATIHENAIEHCDGVDEDCDGVVDNNPAFYYWYLDSDGDGYGDDSTRLATCSPSSNYVRWEGDCNEADATIHPHTSDLCDGIDQDCDGTIDEDAPNTWYADADGDGYVDRSVSLRACSAPAGYLAQSAEWDCDDTNLSVHIGAPEYCNGIDDDCNGTADEEWTEDGTTWYSDLDGDGYGGDWQQRSCTPGDPSWISVDGDCDDAEPAISPAATETCDGHDSDCNGISDGCVAPGEQVPDAVVTLGTDQYLTGLALLPDQTGDGVSELLIGRLNGGYEFLLLDGAATPGGVETAVLATWPSPTMTLLLSEEGVGDFDADGLSDFLLWVELDSVHPDGLAYLIPSNLADQTDPAITPWATIEGSSSYPIGGSSISAADLDDDGRSEVVTSASYAAILLYELGAAGVSTPADASAIIEEPGTSFYAQFGGVDMDGDGYEELWAWADDTLLRFPGPVSGSLDIAASERSFWGWGGTWLQDHAVADMDGDGREDLWICGLEHSYLLKESTADGELDQVAEVRIDTALDAWDADLAAADFGGDGQVDLALGAPYDDQQAAYGGKVYLFDGPFSGVYVPGDAPTSYTGTVQDAYVGATLLGTDLNLDGQADVVVGAWSSATGPGSELLFLYGGW